MILFFSKRLDQNSRALKYLSDILATVLNNHLGKMAALPNFLNGNFSLDFIVAQVAEK